MLSLKKMTSPATPEDSDGHILSKNEDTQHYVLMLISMQVKKPEIVSDHINWILMKNLTCQHSISLLKTF